MLRVRPTVEPFASSGTTRLASVCLALVLVGCVKQLAERGREQVATVAPAPTPRPDAALAPAVQTHAVREELLEFVREGRRFHATVSVPMVNERHSLPGVIIVHGSGPMNRDGDMSGQLGVRFGFAFSSYRSLAEHLSARGVVVLRYDKRTASSATDTPELDATRLFPPDVTTVTFAEDAKAALHALAAHEAVDPSRLFFIGHSQGGQMVPWLLNDEPEARGGILLATPHQSVEDLIRRQGLVLTELLEKQGYLAAEAQENGQLLVSAADQIEQLQPEHLDGVILDGDKQTWYTWQLMSRGAPWLATRLRRPLLVVGGGADSNVEQAEWQNWRQTLAPQASVGHEFHFIPCMTHALNCVGGSPPDPVSRPDAELAPGLAERIATFIERSSDHGRGEIDGAATVGAKREHAP